MSARRRQLAILAALLAVLVVVVVLPFLDERGALSPAARGGDRARAGARASLGDEIVDLRIADLEQKPGRFSPGRDPFRFAPVKAPQPPRQQQQAPRQRPQQPRQQQQANRAAAARPQPPQIDFTYLGSFGPTGRRIAVFSDKAEIYNARLGEVVKEKFVVRNIGYESADVGFVDFPDEPSQRLAVGG